MGQTAGEATRDWTALRLALELHRGPWRVRLVRTQPLPAGIGLLLTVAAGEAEADAAAALGRPAADIREAATFFIAQILLAPGTDSYRVLGAGPGATTGELRHNMALLMRWLHPDVAREGEPAVLAARIAAAWNTLKTPERRAAYDRECQGAAALPTGDADLAALWARAEARRSQRPGAAGRVVRKRRLPRLLAFWLLGRSRD
jgi:hypothetical protein